MDLVILTCLFCHDQKRILVFT